MNKEDKLEDMSSRQLLTKLKVLDRNMKLLTDKLELVAFDAKFKDDSPEAHQIKKLAI